MRPEGNPLDLNNLPDEYSRDGKQLLEDTSSPGNKTEHRHAPRGCGRKKKNGGKDGKEECGKVYECRFCSLKFCKSQALGGHMNRHRQERETETLNHARQLVFRNDHNIVPQPPSHLGCCPPIAPAGYHPATGNMGAGDPTMPLRFPRYFSSGSSSSTHMMPPPPPPPQPSQPPYLYASPTRPMSFPTHLIPMNEYHVGHVLSNNNNNMNYGGESSNYTCIGAPVGVGGQSGRGGSSKEGTVQEEGLNWGRSYSGAPSAINRFQDHGF